jgi:hypothetical protein
MKWQSKCWAPLLPLALTVLTLTAPASADDSPMQKRERELLRRLAESDASVAALQQRIERMESRLEALNTMAAGAMKAPAVMPVADRPYRIAQAAAPAPGTSDAGRPAAARSAPGAFEVDEEAAQRALERTLTQSGALLLPAGTFEIAPRLSYTRTEQTTPILLSITDPRTSLSGPALASQRTRRNEITGSLGLKVGLPLDSELEASLPFTRVRSSVVDDLGRTSSANSSGKGDAAIGLAKTFLRESGWRPDIVGRLTYNGGNGKQEDGTVQFNAGYRQLQAEVEALKRQDPIAFTASVKYSKVYEKNSIKPGDAASFSLGAMLAASPATSLQLAFSQIHRKEQELNRIRAAGTSQTYGIVSLGAASVLSRDVTLLTQVGIGLGNDAPKYNFAVTLPILFR